MNKKFNDETQRTSSSEDSNHKDGDTISRDMSGDSSMRDGLDASVRTSRHTARLLQNDPKTRNFRKMSIIVLIIAACAVSGGVYTGLVRSETREFEQRFQDQAKHIGHALDAELDNKLRALDALSVTVTSFAGSQVEQWPFVSVPEFSYRAAGALSVGRGLSIALYPVVPKVQTSQWEQYSVENQHWVDEVVDFQTEFPNAFRPTKSDNTDDHNDHPQHNNNIDHNEHPQHNNNNSNNNNVEEHPNAHNHGAHRILTSHNNSISTVVFQIIGGEPTAKVSDSQVILPMWQHAPVHPGLPRTNYDAFTVERNHEALNRVMESNTAVLGKYYELEESCYGHDLPPMRSALETKVWTEVWEEVSASNHHGDHSNHDGDHEVDHSSHYDISGGLEGPAVSIFYPVFSDLNDNRTVVAVISLTTKWDSFFLHNLPPDPNGLILTLHNECDQSFSFEITGHEVIDLGPGEHHEPEYDIYEKSFVLMHDSPGFTDIPLANQYCTYTASVYPSSQMREQFASGTPRIYTAAVVVIFLFTIFVFVFYDYLVQRRQRQLVEAATRSTAIISSLFPKIVRDRLLDDNKAPDTKASKWKVSSKRNLMVEQPASAPIANFFLNTTVMFGDIAGFTAWSSTRQPSEVFTLLETLYAKFDSIAREMKVFKVETIGDCYVAVTGLPEPSDDHHIRMVKFAKRVLRSMSLLTRTMVVTLGPDTGKLGFRIGLHSGPVTAGVLRGEKSRFQLFGDTVNMASRMESTGQRNCIQVSNYTAELLILSGKEKWISKREDLVEAKGKGTVQTYWVQTASQAEKRDDSTSFSVEEQKSSLGSSVTRTDSLSSQQKERSPLIEWQVELLSRLIKGIAAKRSAVRTRPSLSTSTRSLSYDPRKVLSSSSCMPRDLIVEEVKLSSYQNGRTLRQMSKKCMFEMQLPPMVHDQLVDFVTAIAMLYHYNNSFHNYEHACHVTMSANKFLTRVVDPNQRSVKALSEAGSRDNSFAFGLTGDPLTQFAIIFSALIHDVDHQGVSNTQLNDENNRIALMYNKKSPAEQNSIDLAFEVLGSPQYSDLVSYICADEKELKRLRELVVNCVMATDIFDKELLAVRNKKWQRAFNSDGEQSTSDLKATIVIEHIIQAADVAHTMQHWHVYQKWNERLFF